jgi:hypothetical protein
MDQPQVLGTILEAHAEARKKERRNQTKEQSSQALADRPARRADCLHGPRGPSANVPRTVCTGTADCPLKPTEPPVVNPEKWIVRGEHADCPPGTRGLSAQHTRTVRNLAQPKLKNTTDRKRSRARTRRTHDEHCPRGPSATTSRIVRPTWTDPETARLRGSTPPTHHRISQTVEAVETRVWGHDKCQTRMLYPKTFSS